MAENSQNHCGVSRRDALKAGAVGCSGVVAAASTGIDVLSSGKSSIEQWEAIVGQEVRVLELSFHDHKFEKPIVLRLVEAMECGVQPQPGQSLPSNIRSASISLVFEADMRTNLPSATYKISHPSVGKLDVLLTEIVPIADSNVRNFEAILN